LDYDDAGKSAIRGALDAGVLMEADYAMTRVRGTLDAELEDCLTSESVRPIVLSAYGLDISDPSFGGNRKWSDRMQAGFEASGKLWTKELEFSLKEKMAILFEEKPLEKMRDPAAQLFRRVAGILENKFA
jgi:hypothetical protein